MTLQAEDEIAAANVALGAAFAGDLGVTGTSGPGMDLKAETLGLAVILELPMVIVDVQRAGPSTGMPTKTEQSDLLLALFGRHGESPMPIVAARSPSHCFDAAIEAARIAVTYRTPVILLSDTFLANSSEPWLLPDVDTLPDDRPGVRDRPERRQEFLPYLRDERLARPWAVPGTEGLRHRIGGLEKEDGTGDISYDPENHERMTRLRAAKVAKVADDDPAARGRRPGRRRRAPRARVGLHLRHDPGRRSTGPRAGAIGGDGAPHAPQPVPGEHRRGRRALPEGVDPRDELGQLAMLIRGRFLVDAISFTKVQGQPIFAEELEQEILRVMDA